MLQGRQLWATNVRFMNDTSELGYGIRLVREVLEEPSETIGRVGAKTRRVIQKYRDSILAMLADSEVNTTHFAVCFCENDNLLSQWRGYGALGAGFAVGFKTKALFGFEAEFLRNVGVNAGTLGVILRRVIYDLRIQKRLVRSWIKIVDAYAASRARAVPAASIRPFNDASFSIYRMLYECLVCFKNPGFSEEGEWRLVQQGRVGDADVCRQSFRARNGRIVSYAPLTFPSRAGARGDARHKANDFPIAALRYGPTLDTKGAERALELLLNSHGFDLRAIRVQPSGIPFST